MYLSIISTMIPYVLFVCLSMFADEVFAISFKMDLNKSEDCEFQYRCEHDASFNFDYQKPHHYTAYYFCIMQHNVTNVTWLVNNSTIFNDSNSYSYINSYDGKNETQIGLYVKPHSDITVSSYEFELRWMYGGKMYSFNAWKRLIVDISMEITTHSTQNIFAIKCRNGYLLIKRFGKTHWYQFKEFNVLHEILEISSSKSMIYACSNGDLSNLVKIKLLKRISSIFDNEYVIATITLIISFIVIGIMAYIISIIYECYYRRISDHTIVMR